VGGNLEKALLEPSEGPLADPGAGRGQVAAAAPEPKLRQCFHCGDPCPDELFSRGEKVFCCQGCLAVHEVLAASGLDRFYQLAERPGVRVREPAQQERWTCLDDPAVRARLLDFADGGISRVTFRLPAIHCVACVWLLENLFRLHAGIGKSQVNFPRREATITFVPARIPLSELAALLSSIGYEPQLTLEELEKPAANPEAKRRWLQIGVAGFAFGNIMLLSIPGYLGLDSFSGPMFNRLFGWLSLALATPVLVYSAGDYWRAALLAIRQRVLTLDVPIALGLAALYLESAAAILSGRGPGYLDSLTGLVFFLLCGRAFQQKTYDRITFDRDYKCFFPLSVLRKTEAGVQSVAISELRIGDRLLVRNGELIPADARLIHGPALIDYSFVTGESEPVARETGDRVYAGGRQVGRRIEIELVKEASQSYLASLWDHEVFRKPRNEDLGTQTDRYSRWFTQAVIALAVAAALSWCLSGQAARGLRAFTSVLIVACPCALALAAPFALGTAQRWLARLQVFLKNALVLERLARVNAIVFDKTGTLTCAGSTEAIFHPLNGGLAAPDRSRLAALVQHSTHPHSARIAEALATEAEHTISDFQEVPGGGLQGMVDGRYLRLGSARWLRRQGLEVPELPGANGSASYVATDNTLRGGFALHHPLRPHAEHLLSNLAERCELALLSGDHEKERQTFRRLFGPTARLLFNQSPLEKLAFIARLQAEGRTVMMVGDGLNDAGALKQSDVGVAVVEQVGAFSPASDMILRASDVPRLGQILALGRKSAHIVRLSLAISAVYNLVGISVAAAGWLSPIVCAVLMPLSSISVVLFACGAASRAARKAGLDNLDNQACRS